MISTKVNAAGKNEGSEEIVTGPINHITKVPWGNPYPVTVRNDAAGASEGTTEQRNDSLVGPVLEGADHILTPFQ